MTKNAARLNAKEEDERREALAVIGAAGRARVIENYTWSVVAARTADWYRQCLAKASERAKEEHAHR